MSRIIKLEKSIQLKKNIGEIYQRTKEIMHLNMLYLGTPTVHYGQIENPAY
jgi:hypothetical protein